jgi:hypothetical protein
MAALATWPQANSHAMIDRRAPAARIATKLGNHSFRPIGITSYLNNGGTLQRAAAIANHAAMRTTQLYDRRRETGLSRRRNACLETGFPPSWWA